MQIIESSGREDKVMEAPPAQIDNPDRSIEEDLLQQLMPLIA